MEKYPWGAFDSNSSLRKPVNSWVGGRQPVLREVIHSGLLGGDETTPELLCLLTVPLSRSSSPKEDVGKLRELVRASHAFRAGGGSCACLGWGEVTERWAYNHPIERHKDSRYFLAIADNTDNTRGGGHRPLFGRPRLDFREDISTRRPADGTSSQHFHDSMSISFKTEHSSFARPSKSGGGFLGQNPNRDNICNTIAGHISLFCADTITGFQWDSLLFMHLIKRTVLSVTGITLFFVCILTEATQSHHVPINRPWPPTVAAWEINEHLLGSWVPVSSASPGQAFTGYFGPQPTSSSP